MLDGLRGVALLGILFANLVSFAGYYVMSPAQLAALPTAHLDKGVLFSMVFLVEGKFYSLFSLLFGVGRIGRIGGLFRVHVRWPFAPPGFGGSRGVALAGVRSLRCLPARTPCPWWAASLAQPPLPMPRCRGPLPVSAATPPRAALAAWIGAWTPGSLGTLLPPGTGIRIPPGSKVVLQVHSNLSGANAAPDRTSIGMTLASSVDKVAIVQPWANPAWLRSGGMPIPAGAQDAHHRFSFDMSTVLSLMTGGAFQDNQPVTVYGVSLHMHTLGAWAKMELERRTGATECMLHIPRWDFHWQGSYEFAQPKVVKPGDRIAVECHWNNGLPNAKDVEWGEGTGDEMCLGTFLMTQ